MANHNSPAKLGTGGGGGECDHPFLFASPRGESKNPSNNLELEMQRKAGIFPGSITFTSMEKQDKTFPFVHQNNPE